MSKKRPSVQRVKRGKAAHPRRAARTKPSWLRQMWGELLVRQPFAPATIRRGLVTAMLAIVAFGAFQVGRFTGINAWAGEQFAHAVADAGFSVQRIEVVGANRIDRLRVYDSALRQKDRSMAAFNLDEVRRDLEANGWVGEARVSRRLPDTLVIDLVERTPVAVWQEGEQYVLIDKHGTRLPGVDPASVPNLPIIVGQNARQQMQRLDELLAAAPALKPQLSGARWLGNRRWDLYFRTGEVLLLPEDPERAREAFAEFARLDGINRLLGRNIRRFDMRLPDRLVLRPGRRGEISTLDQFSGGNVVVEPASGQEI